MLGRDADAIFWLFRYVERSENLATLLDTFFGLTLTDFEGLHNEEAEPECEEPFDWSWDNFEPTKDIL